MLNLADDLRAAVHDHKQEVAVAIQERREYARSLANELINAGVSNVVYEETPTAAKVSFAEKHYIDFTDKLYKRPAPYETAGYSIIDVSFANDVTGQSPEGGSILDPITWGRRDRIIPYLKKLIIQENLIPNLKVELTAGRTPVTDSPIFK